MEAEAGCLPWQGDHWAMLDGLRLAGRLPHALLLAGPGGTGKGRFADAFAGLLLCAAPGAIRCGKCRDCRLVSAGTHPDLAWLRPEESGKAIRVDQVRALREFCTTRPHQGGWRVMVIEPAEALNANAANALLKTLEEPGAETLLLLVAHEPARLPATIRSRCRLLRFPVPDAAVGLTWLRGQLPAEVDAEALLEIAGWRPLHALTLVDQARSAQIFRVRQLADGVAAGTLVPAAAAAEAAGLDRTLALEAFTALLAARIRGCVMAGGSPPLALFECLDALTETRRELAASPNLQAELLWNRLWLEWRRALAGPS